LPEYTESYLISVNQKYTVSQRLKFKNTNFNFKFLTKAKSIFAGEVNFECPTTRVYARTLKNIQGK